MLTGARAASVAIGQERQAGASEARGNFEAAQDTRNATLAATQSLQTTQEGSIESRAAIVKGRVGVGQNRASYGAQGVDISTGSAVDVQGNTSRMSTLDAAMITNNAARKAWGYDVEAQSYREQSILAKLSGDNTASGLRAQSASTLLTGASQMYSEYFAAHPKVGSPGAMTGGRTQH
jgi:hypothetical protein